jgi:hypothetical protein
LTITIALFVASFAAMNAENITPDAIFTVRGTPTGIDFNPVLSMTWRF